MKGWGWLILAALALGAIYWWRRRRVPLLGVVPAQAQAPGGIAADPTGAGATATWDGQSYGGMADDYGGGGTYFPPSDTAGSNGSRAPTFRSPFTFQPTLNAIAARLSGARTVSTPAAPSYSAPAASPGPVASAVGAVKSFFSAPAPAAPSYSAPVAPSYSAPVVASKPAATATAYTPPAVSYTPAPVATSYAPAPAAPRPAPVTAPALAVAPRPVAKILSFGR